MSDSYVFSSQPTLLEVVQHCLSENDSDEVNSIGDTVEAQGYADIVRKVFYSMFNNISHSYYRKLGQLKALSNIDLPNIMSLPTDCIDYETIWYTDAAGKLYEVEFMDPEEFILKHSKPSSGTKKVKRKDWPTFYIPSNDSPKYYTTFDNQDIIFNSYDSKVDTTLQNEKSGIWYVYSPAWLDRDDYVLDIPLKYHSEFLHRVLSETSIKKRQIPSPSDDVGARKQAIRRLKDDFKKRQLQGLNSGQIKKAP